MEKLIKKIGNLDVKAMEKAQGHLDSLTKPPGSLGVLERIAVQLAGITGEIIPDLRNKVILVMVGDHGVVEEGVSAFPQEVTAQMVHNFLQGGAAINVLARHSGARVLVADLGMKETIDHPQLVAAKVRAGTGNMARGPAMTREEAMAAIKTGARIAQEQIAQGAQLLATGEMGIGNTTASSAIAAAFTGLPVDSLIGIGTGLDEKGRQHKIQVVKKALACNDPDPHDPIDVLAKVGGLEIAGLTGAILAAGANGVPMVIDGLISSAAALTAIRLAPQVRDYIIPSHLSEEPGHKILLESMGLQGMLHMQMRLGEGTGAALAFPIIDAVGKLLAEMATFQSAGISSGS
ncbi:MAG: nicotinate-nucleotide--dimethylbenzimidazole phosphoribosyltransferase [Limnochordia bacterium]|jgi:nicotinate-nucleotide--dimethylbenzimidazole phosphoribosyltransferase